MTRLPKQYEEPESLKKALQKARNEKQRISAIDTSSALAAANKKPFVIKKKK